MFAAIRFSMSDTPTLRVGSVQTLVRSTIVAMLLISMALVGYVSSCSAQNRCEARCPDGSMSEGFNCSDPNYVPACYRGTGSSGGNHGALTAEIMGIPGDIIRAHRKAKDAREAKKLRELNDQGIAAYDKKDWATAEAG